MNIWQRPDFVELCMNAEIGAYQEDTSEEREAPPLLQRDASSEGQRADVSSRLKLNHVA